MKSAKPPRPAHRGPTNPTSRSATPAPKPAQGEARADARSVHANGPARPRQKPAPGAATAAPPADVREGFIAVGTVLTSFGLHGELKVEPLTDFAERFAPGARLWLAGEERTVEHSRWQRGTVYLKLHGIDSLGDVAPLRGFPLEVPETERAELPADEYFQSDLIGLRVVTTGGEELGRVREFLATGANDVLAVDGPRGEVLVPMIADVVQAIDLPAGTITIEPVEGLLPEPRTPKPPRLPSWRYKQLKRAQNVADSPPNPPDSGPKV